MVLLAIYQFPKIRHGRFHFTLRDTTVSLLSCPSAQELRRKRMPVSVEKPVTAAVLRDTTHGTLVLCSALQITKRTPAHIVVRPHGYSILAEF